MSLLDFIIIGVIAILVAAILFYLYKEKKNGATCIGCPYGRQCSKGCGGGCGKDAHSETNAPK